MYSLSTKLLKKFFDKLMFCLKNLIYYSLIFVFFNYNFAKKISKENQLINVVIVKPKMQNLSDEIYVTGKATAQLSQDITSKIEGKITSVIKHDEEQVKKGEVIIAINQTLAEAALLNAEEALNNAKHYYEDQLKLAKKNFTSENSKEKANSEYLNAKYNFEKVKKEYNNMIIKAPFDGEVSSVELVEGNDVKPGDFLFTITSGNVKNIILNVPEKFIFAIKKTTKVFIENSYQEFIEGKILSTTNSINKSGHGIIKVELDSKDILHGSFVQAKLFINPRMGITIPSKAIMRSKDGTHIYTASDEGIAKKVAVTISDQKHDIVEILSNNIKIDDSIIIEGLTKVYDNAKINIISDLNKE